MYYSSVMSSGVEGNLTYPILIGDDDTAYQLVVSAIQEADLLMSRFSSTLQSSMGLDCSSALRLVLR